MPSAASKPFLGELWRRWEHLATIYSATMNDRGHRAQAAPSGHALNTHAAGAGRHRSRTNLLWWECRALWASTIPCSSTPWAVWGSKEPWSEVPQQTSCLPSRADCDASPVFIYVYIHIYQERDIYLYIERDISTALARARGLRRFRRERPACASPGASTRAPGLRERRASHARARGLRGLRACAWSCRCHKYLWRFHGGLWRPP
jgi:hypothetical protein